ncbi:MAG: hypothetical protein ACD_50C00153G0002 [uncultured bacterium]|nr:MAG: hypothetical protein ACD_50C00153G0002 [uncultured bacterium]
MDPQKGPKLNTPNNASPISPLPLTSLKPPLDSHSMIKFRALDNIKPQVAKNPKSSPSQPHKIKKPGFWSGLKWYEYFVCGIPLILIFIGGLIGGAIGGGAFAINIKLWKSSKSKALKIAGVTGITIGAFIITLVLAIIVRLLFGI